ncbi:MAG: phosphoribosylformylglycinamidine synthase II [Ectothiorhodospiraceae bacterium]|nr:phosphoribosylformylglycinamidine synthase II [Ectothiorhodospiraceae bacterium]
MNAMAVGIVKHDETVSAIAEGEGNPVFIVGSATGRDGIHGATFASEELSSESEEKRPSVQVGDPFTEKLLLEASLEIIKEDLVVGMQDMGAAGISCSTTEMSAKGKVGMDINLDLVPMRETGMSAYEILLSESQERMLVVGKKGKEAEIRAVFEKWDLHAVEIGKVTSDGIVRMRRDGELKAEVPADSLVLGGGAPVYIRETRRPSYLDTTLAFQQDSVPVPEDIGKVLLSLMGSPNIASKRWVYEQYDQSVRTNTVISSGGDAAVTRIKGTLKALSVSTDCNGRYVYLNPKKGAMIAVAEAARNVVCTGARPLGVTNCLNFGNPYKPEIYYQFKEACAGMGEACERFETPVTGGNVSFYNENPTGAVYPTPVIGLVGLIEDVKNITPAGFQDEGDIVFLLGKNRNEIAASEYLATIHGIVAGDAPYIDLDEEKLLQDGVLALIDAGLVKSAHDISDGGLSVALAECCIIGRRPVGASIRLYDRIRRDALYFGESQGRYVLTCAADAKRDFVQKVMEHDLEIQEIGVVGGDILTLNDDITLNVPDIHSTYYNALEQLLES